jgi:phage repressor protein C with HTH and peptisase S24 domain
MITNDKIWKALDRLAVEHGLTRGGLARAAQLDHTIFNRSKRTVKATGKVRWPSSGTIAKVLNVTGMSMAQFGQMVDGAAAFDRAVEGGGRGPRGKSARRGH